ncbi:MAG: hypothetical protein A3J93_04375 [Candidatus Magasanikbacteria bacterium RIFOXYC2_FULL_42_28]|uniref:MBL fold hydrolase n=1 Tax=Candidatus Magasanikbacteria bacterium RIFOXYC2_FULL_42_28 TaxID=1798704 RepID=A0A1F6NX56_9BACT|nr:MAG: hypothetical protein A3J93_04375 [Candidatus Magasanikbacteria bacterium RIFOXYC2_FULL_42_28]
MNITFCGAARVVTGSCSLVEATGQKILVDCGMFQGGSEMEKRNGEQFLFVPSEINAVVITHAHLDHIGRLPLLVKRGFTGWIYGTPATLELARLILEDAVSVMEHNSINYGTPILYDEIAVAECAAHFKPLDYYEELILAGTVSGGIKIKLRDAGHIFGAAAVEICAEGKRVVFSGDVGNAKMPIIRETDSLPADIDALICESTYGDRLHEREFDRQTYIEKKVKEAIDRGGTLMMPAFSLERTQELLYDLNDLVDRKKRLPRVPIFVDSPLAIKATAVYRKYPQYYDEASIKLLQADDDLFNFPGLKMCLTREDSKHINAVPSPKIIIAGSGMMNGGRIIYHALRYLEDPNSTLLFIGYQAEGTLGRKIFNGDKRVHILGETVNVRCHVEAVGALSAHADQEKLLDWIGGGPTLPKKVYLNHGEPGPAEAFAKLLKTELGVKATVVDFGLKVKV